MSKSAKGNLWLHNKKSFRQNLFFCSGGWFSLASNFQLQGNRGRCEQNTMTHPMHRHKHFVCTSHMVSHAHAWLKMFKLCLPSKIFPHLVTCRARHMSFDPHSTPSLLFSTRPSSTSPILSGSRSTSFQPRTRADPHSLRGDGFTESELRTLWALKLGSPIPTPIPLPSIPPPRQSLPPSHPSNPPSSSSSSPSNLPLQSLL